MISIANIITPVHAITSILTDARVLARLLKYSLLASLISLNVFSFKSLYLKNELSVFPSSLHEHFVQSTKMLLIILSIIDKLIPIKNMYQK